MLVGVISDTHGLLRPEAVAALRDAKVAHILHAGDVGNFDILDTLRAIAPVTAIRGNIDLHGQCAELPATEAIELDSALFYLVHSVHDLDVNPVAAQLAAVVSGHSHQPGFEMRDGVLYLNPGSAGPRRFKLPVTLAFVEIDGGVLTPTILPLL
ncbi:metallophosphoesterase family protein [Granulicella arctica]|uniref:metallophosphoesterase family protein n=1 Tax=Granulicella arctica TaxID=940613 RepID=UPI0021DF8EE3|nr:metallophosphoesterase family protein [Granulicella arctica]